MLNWVVLALIIIFIALFLYWTLVISEGSYLGARFVAWLYDLSARRYDRIKRFDDSEEDWYVGQPLWRTIRSVQHPLVLDVACGTARLSLALLRRFQFDGRIIALDLSRKMLRRARAKVAAFGDRVILLRQNAMQLPFPDATFDVVTCLEALEFLPHPTRALGEMWRVLRPGGVLFVTNRIGWEALLLPGKALSARQLRAALDSLDSQMVEVRHWQVFYDQVWARKKGGIQTQGNGRLALSEVLFCPHCPATFLLESGAAWQCPACQRRYPIEDDILLLADGRLP